MPIFYIPWDKTSTLKKALTAAILYYKDRADIYDIDESWAIAFAAALLDQIDQEWTKDKENYKRFLERGIEYDEVTRRHSETGQPDDRRGASSSSGRREDEQVPRTPGEEAEGEEEDHF